MRKIAVVVCLFAVFVGACGNDDDPTVDATPEATKIEITAEDFRFSGAPATVDVPHLATITVKNDGAENHEAALLKLEAGKTLDDATAFLSAPSGPPPFVEFGGTTGTDPGTSTSVTHALPAGSYAFICFIPSPDGKPHFAKGMLAPLTVTGNSTTSLPLPDGVNATGAEYAFDLPALKAGPTTIRFSNTGEESHVLGMARVADGKTGDDALTWLSTRQGPPPMRFMGGPLVGPGGRSAFKATLTKGTYVFYCPVPVAGDQNRTPHYARGMLKAVTIT